MKSAESDRQGMININDDAIRPHVRKVDFSPARIADDELMSAAISCGVDDDAVNDFSEGVISHGDLTTFMADAMGADDLADPFHTIDPNAQGWFHPIALPNNDAVNCQDAAERLQALLLEHGTATRVVGLDCPGSNADMRYGLVYYGSPEGEKESLRDAFDILNNAFNLSPQSFAHQIGANENPEKKPTDSMTL